ncbi:hypothetical protein BDV41DRAFT_570802 [Aspergillus transmontanensis]|uniref:Uncharacterized protein n=1 Tax=Aspergillus transmontanensis TaxID=1034304 RepID=A0A5N6WGW7_9EURO|nr:hypothetical protein BDV41DRAFT_570802 [Aspergillus transmontanensis]
MGLGEHVRKQILVFAHVDNLIADITGAQRSLEALFDSLEQQLNIRAMAMLIAVETWKISQWPMDEVNSIPTSDTVRNVFPAADNIATWTPQSTRHINVSHLVNAHGTVAELARPSIIDQIVQSVKPIVSLPQPSSRVSTLNQDVSNMFGINEGGDSTWRFTQDELHAVPEKLSKLASVPEFLTPNRTNKNRIYSRGLRGCYGRLPENEAFI